MALGFENGQILIVNLLYDEILQKFSQEEEHGAIKSMSFSTDVSLGVSLLATVTDSVQGG